MQSIGKMLTPHQRNHSGMFPDSSLSRVMLCGGHVDHAHPNNLTEYNGNKSVDLSFVATHQKDYPQLATTKYERETTFWP